jgi:transcriptional regulator with GAF, ATPase, and Fis domain
MEITRSSWGRPRLRAAAGPHFQRYGIVGASDALADVIRRIDLVAATRSTVLITGETGTGKELVARAVHACSAQRTMPFVKVNCAAIPDALLESELFGHVRGAFTDASVARRGKFALANGGTILLDEIGTMSVRLQAKLLRVLQEREFEPLGAERVERVDVRVVAATNRDLRQLVADGLFQDDLYYRLHVVPIPVPPLRERADDIGMLADYFAEKHAARNGKPIAVIEPETVALLQRHNWPGNVRELENTIERAVVLTSEPVLTPHAITIEPPAAIRGVGMPSLKLRANVEWMEQETIRRALRASPLKRHAADLMGISPRALSHYLAKYPSLERDAVAVTAAASRTFP